jgi:hypothetical protein
MKKPALLVPTVAAVVMALCPVVHAQGTPEDKPLEAEEVRARLAGKAFGILSTDGVTMLRVQYDTNGVVYLNLTGGSAMSGKWTAKPGMVCTSGGTNPESCRDLRRAGEGLEMKRVDGKWVPLVPR